MSASGAIVDLPAADLAWFSSTGFGATAGSYSINSLSLNPVNGAFNVQAAAIPLPPSLALAIVWIAALRATRRGRGVDAVAA